MTDQVMSESVYKGLCREIGTPQQVAYRRDILDITELFIHRITRIDRYRKMRSGSSSEGFRLRGSDLDSVFWPPNHKVIWYHYQSFLYKTHVHVDKYAWILCDNFDSPPGYTLLWLPTECAGPRVLSACEKIQERLYISSSKYRESSLSRPGSTVHGPCRSGKVIFVSYDDAYGFGSDFWPPSASSWIERCHAWPSPHVVENIVRNGCHFVAIGHKLGNHIDNEWRISFTQAEKKLVYSMNHTQFLTYGLLKLVLNEKINIGLKDEDKLLCSYQIKTVVFWAIQQNPLHQWCPQKLLAGFWVCFKLLIKWVYEGVCPNFFIPQNNMFLTKIHGSAQVNLFKQLYRDYEEYSDIAFISSPTIGRIIEVRVFSNLRINFLDVTKLSGDEVDVYSFAEIESNEYYLPDLQTFAKAIKAVERQLYSPLTECQFVWIQKCTVSNLQRAAFILLNTYTKGSSNKLVYSAHNTSLHMLKLAAKFGCVSDLLYIAIYFYKTCRYREALSVIEKAKDKLAQPHVIYWGRVKPEQYTKAVDGMSMSAKMRHAVAIDVSLENDICYINELISEQRSSKQNGQYTLFIPPFILLHMLEFFCFQHVDAQRAKAALKDIELMVHCEKLEVVHVPMYDKDISWEILGICQQITGNLQAALYSYKQSLKYPYQKIQTATIRRICDLIKKMRK